MIRGVIKTAAGCALRRTEASPQPRLTWSPVLAGSRRRLRKPDDHRRLRRDAQRVRLLRRGRRRLFARRRRQLTHVSPFRRHRQSRRSRAASEWWARRRRIAHRARRALAGHRGQPLFRQRCARARGLRQHRRHRLRRRYLLGEQRQHQKSYAARS